jgi:hypothetical protein
MCELAGSGCETSAYFRSEPSLSLEVHGESGSAIGGADMKLTPDQARTVGGWLLSRADEAECRSQTAKQRFADHDDQYQITDDDIPF